MKLENEFSVSAPVATTWETLLDIERVASCLPGASVQASGDGTYSGAMKMKLGPLSIDYQGSARMVDVDEDAHVATLEATAREAKGQGTASALITNRLIPEGDRTRVIVETELNITGRPAQFGRGIMQDVSERMLGQFAKRLEQEILSGAGRSTESAERPADGAGAPRPAQRPPSEPAQSVPDELVIGSVVAGPLIKRLLPAAAGVLLLALLGTLLRGRRGPGVSIKVDLK
jgi:carbon monoxide dehydrogenase subunit G